MIRRLAAASAASMAVSAMLAAVPACASGVEHVIDDSAVETPGTCHVESWVTMVRRDSGIATVAPTCTRRHWTNLELGGFVSTAWDGDARETQIGVTPKWNVRDEKRGLGLALSGSAGIDVTRGRLASASLVASVTIPAGRLRFNLNMGWEWTRVGGQTAIAGAQVDYQATPTLTLMTESFVRDHGRAGGQTGLRWNPRGGRVDLDWSMVATSTASAATQSRWGLTVRRGRRPGPAPMTATYAFLTARARKHDGTLTGRTPS